MQKNTLTFQINVFLPSNMIFVVFVLNFRVKWPQVYLYKAVYVINEHVLPYFAVTNVSAHLSQRDL